MRQIKQLKSKISKTSDPDDIKRLQKELHVAEVDEAYTVNYPHAEAYISLYTKQKGGKQDAGEAPAAKATGEAERPPMWNTVEKAMEEGPESLKELKERRSPDESTANTQLRGASSKSRVQKPTQATEKPAANRPAPPPTGKHGKQPQLNRRERRKLMHKIAPPAHKSDDEDDGEGFFEEA